MSVSVETEPGSDTRSVLGPGGNRVRVSEFVKTKKPPLITKKNKQTPIQETKKLVNPVPVAKSNNDSVNSSCSSDSVVSSASSIKVSNLKVKTTRRNTVKVNGGVEVTPEKERLILVKRCDWITPNSDPLHASFHDEEWGVPVHDDNKLFELLVYSQALAELSWPAILNQRDLFRKLFENFDIESISKFTEKKLLTLKANGKNLLLSEPKLRAIVDNAKQVLKVQHESGSFENYCWSFVNHKQIKNCYRYGRQVPVKSPKAETISKDLMRRGFRCVGPTVVYSFMQVSGIVNDHLISCFRHQECVPNVKRCSEVKIQETEIAESIQKTCSSPI
ncbi:DNA-3-methyladenine glycosylase I [Ranunculus cassubicifolius]